MHPRRALNVVYADMHDRVQTAASNAEPKEGKKILARWDDFDAMLARTSGEWMQWGRDERDRRMSVALKYGEVG